MSLNNSYEFEAHLVNIEVFFPYQPHGLLLRLDLFLFVSCQCKHLA